MQINVYGKDWQEIQKWILARRKQLLERLQDPNTEHDQTQVLRGRLAELKALEEATKSADEPAEEMQTESYGV